MATVKNSKRLRGDLGELVFEHFCSTRQFGYTHLEEIYNTLTPNNILTFRYGWDRKRVVLPHEITQEVRTICQPSNKDEKSPSFVFDYLTVSLRDYERDKITPDSFNWVEIKTGQSPLSPNQLRKRDIVQLKFHVFRINTQFPQEYDVAWEKYKGPQTPKPQ